MDYVYLYFIGAVLSCCVAGFLARGKSLKDDDYAAIMWMCILWPLSLAIVAIAIPILIVFGTPVLLFTICKGDLDDEIKIATKWVKNTWNSIGD